MWHTLEDKGTARKGVWTEPHPLFKFCGFETSHIIGSFQRRKRQSQLQWIYTFIAAQTPIAFTMRLIRENTLSLSSIQINFSEHCRVFWPISLKTVSVTHCAERSLRALLRIMANLWNALPPARLWPYMLLTSGVFHHCCCGTIIVSLKFKMPLVGSCAKCCKTELRFKVLQQAATLLLRRTLVSEKQRRTSEMRDNLAFLEAPLSKFLAVPPYGRSLLDISSHIETTK